MNIYCTMEQHYQVRPDLSTTTLISSCDVTVYTTQCQLYLVSKSELGMKNHEY